MPPHLGILLGAGSVGARHLVALVNRYEHVVVVDPSSSARDRVAQLQYGNCSVLDSLDKAAKLIHPNKEVTAIISNWGPDHAPSFMALADLGVKRFLIEKPMAHSCAQVDAIVERTRNNGLRVLVGTHRRYTGIVESIKERFRENADRPESFIAHGGAMCVVTTGMHWLDLACSLFESLPIDVTASLTDDQINPRAGSLGFWSGTANWRFPDRRFLSVCYSGRSSVAGQCTIYGRNTRVDLAADGSIYSGVRRAEEIQRDGRVTRCGVVVADRLLPEPQDTHSPSLVMLEILDSDEPIETNVEEFGEIMKAMIGALESSDRGCQVDLRLNLDGASYFREWAVS